MDAIKVIIRGKCRDVTNIDRPGQVTTIGLFRSLQDAGESLAAFFKSQCNFDELGGPITYTVVIEPTEEEFAIGFLPDFEDADHLFDQQESQN